MGAKNPAKSRPGSPALSPSTSARAARLAAFTVAAVLLVLVGWFTSRAAGSGRASRAPEVVAPAGELAAPELRRAPPVVLATGPVRQRTLLQPEGEASAEVESAPATISGRLVIDGFAPTRGRVHLRALGGEWERWAGIDVHGRFYVEGAPSSELALAFEAESLFERQLLLPNELRIRPAPGQIEFVDLDWTTRQVNVQIAAPDEVIRPVQVELVGPSYQTRFSTNERGRARLSLVGNGAFSFRAELPTGRLAESAQELDDSGELETIVLVPREGQG